MQRLIVLGLNHTTASLDLREKLVFTPPQRHEALTGLRQKFTDCEAVLLSTASSYTSPAKPTAIPSSRNSSNSSAKAAA